MREVRAFEAKNKFDQLLDWVDGVKIADLIAEGRT